MADFPHTQLLNEIEAFLADTGMGPSYFGRLAVGNSEFVQRLRKSKASWSSDTKRPPQIWPSTERTVRDFMRAKRQSERASA